MQTGLLREVDESYWRPQIHQVQVFVMPEESMNHSQESMSPMIKHYGGA